MQTLLGWRRTDYQLIFSYQTWIFTAQLLLFKRESSIGPKWFHAAEYALNRLCILSVYVLVPYANSLVHSSSWWNIITLCIVETTSISSVKQFGEEFRPNRLFNMSGRLCFSPIHTCKSTSKTFAKYFEQRLNGVIEKRNQWVNSSEYLFPSSLQVNFLL